MSEDRDLRLYIVPPGCGGSFIARRYGGYVLLEAMSDEALQWLTSHVGEEASWDGNHLFIEPRYFPGLCEAIIDEGFLFEINPGQAGPLHQAREHALNEWADYFRNDMRPFWCSDSGAGVFETRLAVIARRRHDMLTAAIAAPFAPYCAPFFRFSGE